MARQELREPEGRKEIDELLVEGAFITPEQLEAARQTADRTKKDLEPEITTLLR